jgi:hypothetical protein
MIRAAAVLVLLVGLTVTIIGTFLPWLISGSVTRNSYQLAAALEQFRLVDSWLMGAAITAWVSLGPILLVPTLLLAVRMWRTAAGVCVALGLVMAGAAITTLVVVGGKERLGIRLADAGPLAVACGSALTIVAGLLLLLSARRDIRMVWSGWANELVTIRPPLR